MKDRARQTSIIKMILLFFVVCLTMVTAADAEDWNRRGRVEYFGLLQNMGGDNTYGSGVMMEVGSTSAIGLGYGSNFSNHCRFTPIVSGGIGFISFSGDVEGFTFREIDLSYNYGGGFRWDITDHFLIKTIYRTTRTTLEETDKALMFSGAVVSIGFAF